MHITVMQVAIIQQWGNIKKRNMKFYDREKEDSKNKSYPMRFGIFVDEKYF